MRLDLETRCIQKEIVFDSLLNILSELLIEVDVCDEYCVSDLLISRGACCPSSSLDATLSNQVKIAKGISCINEETQNTNLHELFPSPSICLCWAHWSTDANVKNAKALPTLPATANDPIRLAQFSSGNVECIAFKQAAQQMLKMKSTIIQLHANTLKLLVDAIKPSAIMSIDKPTLRQNVPPNLSITGPIKNFPRAIAAVEIVKTLDMICCGS